MSQTVYELICERLRATGDAVGVPAHHPSHDVQVEVMCALELVLDVAYHEGTDRELAVAAEACTLAGYNVGSLFISHVTQEDLLTRVYEVRKGRPKQLLRADARGMLNGIRMLSEAGALDSRMTSEARRLRWLARGGHERSYA